MVKDLSGDEPEQPKEDEIKVPNSHVPPGWRGAIGHLHKSFGHSTNDTLARRLAKSGASNRLLEFVRNWASPHCEAQKATTEKGRATIPPVTYFNEGVASDVFFIADDRGDKEKT